MVKVLIVDGERMMQRLWTRRFAGTAEVLSAYTAKEGEELFLSNPEIVIIAVAGRIAGAYLDSEPLIKSFRANFDGPIIGMSALADWQARLVEAGCSHTCERVDLPKVVRQILEQAAVPETAG